jgi:hypothetical protein
VYWRIDKHEESEKYILGEENASSHNPVSTCAIKRESWNNGK